jgi:hypothetical protein
LQRQQQLPNNHHQNCIAHFLPSCSNVNFTIAMYRTSMYCSQHHERQLPTSSCILRKHTNNYHHSALPNLDLQNWLSDSLHNDFAFGLSCVETI